MAEHGLPTFCIPHAGAGASFFKPWIGLGVDGLDLRPVQLPGREERIDEEPYADVGAAVRGLTPQLLDRVPRPARVALFGHSLGAVLAYELARALEGQPGITVAGLFVSGSPGPLHGRAKRATGLDDEGFLARVEEFAGYRHPAFDIPELRELLLPTLRADVAMHENYTPLPGPTLRAPITCLRGRTDELVSATEASTWAAATTASFELIELPGGHMFLVEQAKELLNIMAAGLAPVGGMVQP